MAEKKINFKEGGMIVAALTLYGYVLALSYVSGFYDYYHIPVQFISLDITTICRSIISVGIIAVLLYQAYELVSLTGILKSKSPLWRSIGRDVLAWLGLAIILLLAKPSDQWFFRF